LLKSAVYIRTHSRVWHCCFCWENARRAARYPISKNQLRKSARRFLGHSGPHVSECETAAKEGPTSMQTVWMGFGFEGWAWVDRARARDQPHPHVVSCKRRRLQLELPLYRSGQPLPPVASTWQSAYLLCTWTFPTQPTLLSVIADANSQQL